MNTARILELLDEREYPITGDSPLARYALELRDAIEPLLDRVDRYEKILKTFAKADLNEANCASLAVATSRIRNLAKDALRGKGE